MNQCDNGSFSDEARFESCPYCKENRDRKDDGCSGYRQTVAALPEQSCCSSCDSLRQRKNSRCDEKRKSVLIRQSAFDLHRRSTPRNGFPSHFRKKLYRPGCRDGCSCQTTIPYPVKAMHWSLTMPNTMPFPFRPGRDAALPTAMMNRSKWFIHSKHTTSSRSGKSRLLFLPLCSQQFQWVRNSPCSF